MLAGFAVSTRMNRRVSPQGSLEALAWIAARACRVRQGDGRQGFVRAAGLACARTLTRRPSVGGLSRSAGEAMRPLLRPKNGSPSLTPGSSAVAVAPH